MGPGVVFLGVDLILAPARGQGATGWGHHHMVREVCPPHVNCFGLFGSVKWEWKISSATERINSF